MHGNPAASSLALFSRLVSASCYKLHAANTMHGNLAAS